MTLLLLVAGLVLLVLGAELLVRGASRIAALARISPLVVGLTVVAYGTSTPELAVSIRAAAAAQADIALGNVVGSNIFNVLFILGLSALITPLIVSQQLIRRDVPLMIAVSVFVWLMALDGVIGRIDALVLSLGVVGYTIWAIRQSRKETAAVQKEYEEAFGVPKTKGSTVGVLTLQTAFVLGGLALLVQGASWLVDSASAIARSLGISELVIGLTVVAGGTSLPEVATSVVAAIKGERDIAVGNVVGSNIFNILGVLGVSGLVAPQGIAVASSVVSFDIPFMLAVAVACLPIFFTGGGISRWEGALFFAYYLAYTAYLVLKAAEHDLLPTFSFVLVEFVGPITMVTIAVVAYREVKARSNRAVKGG